MTALSVSGKLRNRYRGQDTDDGDHHQQLDKRKTGFILKSQTIQFTLPLVDIVSLLSCGLSAPSVYLNF